MTALGAEVSLDQSRTNEKNMQKGDRKLWQMSRRMPNEHEDSDLSLHRGLATNEMMTIYIYM